MNAISLKQFQQSTSNLKYNCISPINAIDYKLSAKNKMAIIDDLKMMFSLRCEHDTSSTISLVELAWGRGSVMDCHTTVQSSIPGGNGVKTELQVLRKGQKMGLPSLNYLALDVT